MAREMNRLTARAVETLKAPGLYADGGGLYLRVEATGAKRWTFIYRFGGKRREMGLGRALDVRLAEAREKAAEARRLVAGGTDPVAERRRRVAVAIPTFGEVADQYIQAHAGSHRNAKHVDQWRMTLGNAYCGSIRPLPVNEVSTEHVLGVLRPVWTTKNETASRLRARIEKVLDAAKAEGHRTGENPARWRGHLDKLLPKRQKLQRGHHAAMPYADLQAFLSRLQEQSGVGARALEFLILTAARTSEVRLAKADEFDLERALWIVPAARMKAGREHRVPLPPRAADLVRVQLEVRTGDFVFEGQKRGRPISEGTMTMALRLAGGSAFTVHGFRSSFRDWVAEETEFDERIAEAALAHVVGDATERAYRRGDALEKRRVLMTAWEKLMLPPSLDQPTQ